MFPYRPGGPVRAAGVDRLEGDAVLGSLRVVRHRGVVKPVAPEYLGGQVAGPHLDGAAGVGCRPLQRDDDLRLAGGQVPGRVQRSKSDNDISQLSRAIKTQLKAGKKPPTRCFLCLEP